MTLVEAEEQVRSHLAVLGNAAHSLHPIAGQGFNLSLRDASALAEALLAGPAVPVTWRRCKAIANVSAWTSNSP